MRTVDVDEQCMVKADEVKAGKHRYLILKLNDRSTEIIVEKVGDSGDYDAFVADLPASECRWGVYGFDFQGRRLCLITWSPEEAYFKERMVQATCRSDLRRALWGITDEVQAIDYDEVSYEVVSQKVRRGR